MDIFSSYLVKRDYNAYVNILGYLMDILDYLRNIDILCIYWISISYLW